MSDLPGLDGEEFSLEFNEDFFPNQDRYIMGIDPVRSAGRRPTGIVHEEAQYEAYRQIMESNLEREFQRNRERLHAESGHGIMEQISNSNRQIYEQFDIAQVTEMLNDLSANNLSSRGQLILHTGSEGERMFSEAMQREINDKIKSLRGDMTPEEVLSEMYRTVFL